MSEEKDGVIGQDDVASPLDATLAAAAAAVGQRPADLKSFEAWTDMTFRDLAYRLVVSFGLPTFP